MKPTSQLKRVVKRQGEAVISIRSKIGDKDAEEQVVQKRQVVDDLPEHPAHVQVGGGLTKNLGNYESAKLNVSITAPCENTDKAIRATYKHISALVEELLDVEYDKVLG